MANDMLLLTRKEFRDLPEYSFSLPTGTTPGKAWKSRRTGEWMRGVYGIPYPEGHEHHGSISIGWRRIWVKGQSPSAREIMVPPAPMRGRITPIIWPPAPEPALLPDGLWEQDGVLICHCVICDKAFPAECDPEDFDPDMAYCGGSPRCCP